MVMAIQWQIHGLCKLTGNPVAINPGVKMKKLAEDRNWPIKEWKVK